MAVLRREDAEIYYEEYGQGFPFLLSAPGGMRSRGEMWHSPPAGPPRPWVAWRRSPGGFATRRWISATRAGIAADDGWHTYAADHLALIHLGHRRFHTLGGCIGGCFCLKLCEMAPDSLASAVLRNPIGLHPEFAEYFPEGFVEWTAEQRAARPELDETAMRAVGRNMWGGAFVFCVSRDFRAALPGADHAAARQRQGPSRRHRRRTRRAFSQGGCAAGREGSRASSDAARPGAGVPGEAHVIKHTALGRCVELTEVAETIGFLLSDRASGSPGAILSSRAAERRRGDMERYGSVRLAGDGRCANDDRPAQGV